MDLEKMIRVHPEVQAALDEKRPVVALESTVITHGMPYPDNVQTAALMEQSVRDGGAIPATIAILDGIIFVGIDDDQLERLGRAEQGTVRKCSRRGIPIAVARKELGATTVAGTMIIAELVGIDVFATGGIGGVHRGHPFDVSADLYELGRTPVTVVCSGAKSILDLPATREVLETQGVTIVGYGTDELPAFFSPSSGLPVDVRVESAQEAAAIVAARKALGLRMATLVTVPVPADAGMDEVSAETAIAQATREADEQGIHGPAATPWLLGRVVKLTQGASLHANKALLSNNARTAAAIAKSLLLL